MTTQERIQLAKRHGAERARRILARSAEGAARRELAIRRLKETGTAPGPPAVVAPQYLAAAGTPATGHLVAEGDSWFDYPGTDVLSELEERWGWDVHSVATKGDRVEQMAYMDGQLEEFTKLIKKLIRNNQTPHAVLLSGGGNDLVVERFGTLLNHANSSTPGLNLEIVNGIMARAQDAYVTLIEEVTRVCIEVLGYPLPIVIHGYAYAVPDGRGFWLPVSGPWLQPGFVNKGFDGPLNHPTQLVADVIDLFNTMAQTVASSFANATYVDLRSLLTNDLTHDHYKADWDNELHPTDDAFGRIADAINAVL
jgi:hypothetical protein